MVAVAPAPTPLSLPPGRDVTVDALRGLAMVLVVVGHWLVVVPSYRDGRFDGVNALQTVPLMRGLSWLFQVMPLFFAIGGYAGAASWASARRRAGSAPAYAAWLRSRLARLLGPTLVLVAGWAGVLAAARLAGVDAELARTLGALVVVPVWFLSVYVVVTALVPVSVAAHERFGLAVPAVLAAAAAGVDGLRLAGAPAPVAYVNFFVVYLFAQQLGLWWREGRVRRPALLAGAALAALWILTHAGPYPVSMVGVPGERLANNAPPTLCLAVLGVAQVGLAVRARPLIERLLTRRLLARVATVALNRHAMTILLWHFTALALGALVVLPLGVVPTYPDGTPAWWLVRIATVVALAPVLVALVAALGRFEQVTIRDADRIRTGPLLAAVGLLSAGFALVAVRGLSETGTPLGLPVLALALVGAGALTTRSPWGC